MLVRLIVSLWLALLVGSVCAQGATDSTASKPVIYSVGKGKIIQAGFSYSRAVLNEVALNGQELLVRPIPYISFGYGRGEVLKGAPELFSNERGRYTSWQGRIQLPFGKTWEGVSGELYLSVGRLRGNLPFSAEHYVRTDEAHHPFRVASQLSGELTFRQHLIRPGIRLYPCRFLYVDAGFGMAFERFTLTSADLGAPVKRGPRGEATPASGLEGLFDFRNELSANRTYKRSRLSGIISIGVRI